MKGLAGFLILILTLPVAGRWVAARTLPGDRLEHLRWIDSTRGPSGVMATRPERVSAVPYFANYAAMALVEERPYRPAVRRYMEWYLSHLNLPDQWGQYGTIYDYALLPVEQRTFAYDSADSYAATFLSLASSYLRQTGDAGFVRENLASLRRVASLLASLQEPDGLMRSGGNVRTKYLMNNAEDFRGLEDWADLLEALGYRSESRVYRSRARRLAATIERWMWNPSAGTYRWAIDGEGLRYASDWSRWYPDAVAQLYPGAFGLIPPDGERARALVRTFGTKHPGWASFRKSDPYPWMIVGYAAATAGETAPAEEMLANSRALARGSDRWYNLESAFYLLTERRLHSVSSSKAWRVATLRY